MCDRSGYDGPSIFTILVHIHEEKGNRLVGYVFKSHFLCERVDHASCVARIRAAHDSVHLCVRLPKGFLEQVSCCKRGSLLPVIPVFHQSPSGVLFAVSAGDIGSRFRLPLTQSIEFQFSEPNVEITLRVTRQRHAIVCIFLFAVSLGSCLFGAFGLPVNLWLFA